MTSIIRTLLFSALALIGYFSLTPDPSGADLLRPAGLDQLSGAPPFHISLAPDKITHFVAFAGIGLLVPLARLGLLRSFLPAFLMISSFGLAFEYGQSIWTTRYTDIGDMIANGIGAGLGLIVGNAAEAIRRSIERLVRRN